MNRRLSHLSLLSSLFSLLFVIACGPAAATPNTGSSPAMPAASSPAAFPATVADDTGRQVVVAAEPKHIVSAAPSNTEILYALGLGDRVAGVTTFCDFPEEAKLKPKIGGLRPNVEAIVALQPDLVVATRGFPAEVLAALDAQHVPVAIFNPPDFAGVLGNIHAMGRLTGATGAAEKLATSMQQRWTAVAEKAKTATTKPRVFFEIDATDPSAVSAAGPGTFIDAMITVSGATNVLSTLTPGQQYPKISSEALLQANPQLIILGDSAFGQSAETVAKRPGWNALDAVQKGAIAGIADSNLTSRPGPRLVDGLELVAKTIHPELFGPALASPSVPAGGH